MKRKVFNGTFLITGIVALSNFTLFGQCGVDFTTEAYGSSGTAAQINLSGVSAYGTYSVAVNWGDGEQTNVGFEDQYVHTYANAGSYTICVEYVSNAGGGCYQEVCKSYTITPVSNLCPLSVSPSVSGYTLTVAGTGSGATDPVISFVYDLWAYVADPFNMSLIEGYSAHSHTFSHTYPSQQEKTYTYCVGYGDNNDPEACEANDYCANVSFGSPIAGVNDKEYTYLQVFPIPADDYITIEWNEKINGNSIEFEIIDLTGKTVEKGILTNQSTTLLFPQTLKSGSYFLTVRETSGKTNTVKFTKK